MLSMRCHYGRTLQANEQNTDSTKYQTRMINNSSVAHHHHNLKPSPKLKDIYLPVMTSQTTTLMFYVGLTVSRQNNAADACWQLAAVLHF